jgi:hypothetical protein
LIFYFFILFLIPLYIRIKASNEIFEHKNFALFLIWFSRILSYFLIYHISEYFLNEFVLVVFPVLILYTLYRIYKERVLFVHSYSSLLPTKNIKSINGNISTKII